MAESWPSRLARWRLNLYPAYRGTGARVEYISADWHEVRVRLPLNWRTRNVVGTIFGGSLYASLDPMYMLMLMRILGPDFTVWDKAATIRFLRPGRGTLRATFRLGAELVADIRAEAIARGRLDRDLEVDLVNAAGEVCASCTQTLYVRWRQAPAATSPAQS
jgi:acyl-coenzyme A thioesterase PaaI-like protein